MFGTVARFSVKEGAESQLVELMKVYDAADIPGHVSSVVYRLSEGDRQYIMATQFEDEASYRANAESPEQNERFLAMQDLLEGPPDWHDGDVISVSGR